MIILPIRKILRWLLWLPSIASDLLRHRAMFKSPDKTGEVENIIFVLFDEFYFFKFDFLIAEYLGRTKGRTVVITSHFNRFVGIYSKCMGIETIRLSRPNAKNIEEASHVLKTLECACFDSESNFVNKRKMVNFHFDGIPFGKFIISDVLGRTRDSDYSKIFLDNSIRSVIINRLALSFNARNFLIGNKNVKRLFFNEKNFLPANVVAYAAMDRYQVFEWKPTQRRSEICLKSFTSENWFTHPFSLNKTPTELELMFDGSSETSVGEKIIREKYTNNNWYNRDILIVSKETSLKRLLTRIKIQKPTGIIGIFPHIFWDATFSYGTNFFIDYKSLFQELFALIPMHPELLFVVKFHPDYSFKNSQAKLSVNHDFQSELLNLENQPNVVIFYPDEVVNMYDLLTQLDTIVTVRGTVGIEGAMLGKNVSIFGTGRYSDYGFTHLYKSVEQFNDDLVIYKGKKAAPVDAAARAALYWRELYDKTPIDLSKNLLFSPYGSSTSHPLCVNYVIKSWIGETSDAAQRIDEILK